MSTALLSGLTITNAPPAHAALGRIEPGVEISGVTGYGTTWLGAVEGTAEAQATAWLSWCITAGYDAPSGTGATAIDYVSDPQLAWIVQAHEKDGTDLSRAAIGYLMHTRHETGTAAVSAAARIAAFEASTPQSVKDQASAYLAEAAEQGGPYTAGAASNDYTTARRTGVIHIDPLTSSSGKALAGLSMTATLSGPAVFDTNDNGIADAGETATWTGTTQASRFDLAWVATGNGTVTWSRTVTGLPRQTLTKLSASGEVQDTLTYGLRSPSDPEEITTPGPTFEVRLDFRVNPKSQVVSEFVEPGANGEDRVWLDLVEGDEWTEIDGAYVPVTGTVTAYKQGANDPAQSAGVPSTVDVLGSADFTVEGPGQDYATPVSIPTGDYDGRVVYVVTVKKSQQSHDYLREDAAHDYGLAEETSVVPSELAGTSEVTKKIAQSSDATLTDTFTAHPVDGDLWPAGPDGKAPVQAVYRWTAYTSGQAIPAGTSEAVPSALRELGTGTGTVTKDGDVLSATIDNPYTAAQSGGAVIWVWELREEDQLEEMKPYIVEGWTDGYAVEAETTYVQWEPDVVSNASTRETANGVYFVEELFIGGFPSDHGQYSGSLGFRADEAELTTTMWWIDEPIEGENENGLWSTSSLTQVGSVTTRAENGYFPSIGSTTFLIPGTEPGGTCRPGTAVFQTTFSGDDRVAAFESSLDDRTEQFTIVCDTPDRSVQVTTRAQSTEEVPTIGDGGTLGDTHLVSGDVLEGDRGWSTLHCDLDEDGSFSDDELLWSSDTVMYEAGSHDATEYPVPGGFDYGSSIPEEHRSTAVTCSFGETAVDDGGNVIAEEEPGVPDQTITVLPEPSVWTKAQPSDDDPTVGDEIWDLIGTEGTFPEGSTTGADLFYAAPGEDLTCDEPVWTSTSVELVAGTSEYETDRYVTDREGTYGFVETTYGPDGAVVSTGECGASEETLTVITAPRLAVTGAGLTAGAIGLLLLAAGGALVVVRRRAAGRTEAEQTT